MAYEPQTPLDLALYGPGMRFYEDAIREAGGIPPLVALLAGGPESEAAISDHAGTSVEWDFEAPPWACSCARCASKTGDGRATSGCLREGYHTVWVVGEAIAEVEQQYAVGCTQSFSETVSYLRAKLLHALEATLVVVDHGWV